jgi:hypothetical protein
LSKFTTVLGLSPRFADTNFCDLDGRHHFANGMRLMMTGIKVGWLLQAEQFNLTDFELHGLNKDLTKPEKQRTPRHDKTTA